MNTVALDPVYLRGAIERAELRLSSLSTGDFQGDVGIYLQRQIAAWKRELLVCLAGWPQ